MPPGTNKALRATYTTLPLPQRLDDDVLTALVFGESTPCPVDPRCLRIGLEPLPGAPWSEIWRGSGPVRTHTAGPIRYVEDGEHFAGWISLDESRFDGLAETTEAAYAGLLALHAELPYRHVWRLWNFVTAINEGEGDAERYRQFCLGRARAFAASRAGIPAGGYPAASAIGKQHGSRSLQVCWFAGREPGRAVENPRQFSAYRYPRQYGPAAPSFSRATVVPGPMVLVSGTASILGHQSMHPGDLDSQLRETLSNLDAVIDRAHAIAPAVNVPVGRASLIKVYVRNADDAPRVERGLRQHLGNEVPILILAGDICRLDLMLEIEIVHGSGNYLR